VKTLFRGSTASPTAPSSAPPTAWPDSSPRPASSSRAGALRGALAGYVAAYVLSSLLGPESCTRSSTVGTTERSNRRRDSCDGSSSTASRTAATRAGVVLDSRVDSLLLGVLAGPVAVGFYTVARQIADVCIVPAQSVGCTITPRAGRAEGRRPVLARRASLYERSLENVLLLYIPAGVGLVLVAEPAIRYVFTGGLPGSRPRRPVVLAVHPRPGRPQDHRQRAGLPRPGPDPCHRADDDRARQRGPERPLDPQYGAVGAGLATVTTYTLYTIVNVYYIHREFSLRLGFLARRIAHILAVTSVMAGGVVLALPYVTSLVTLAGAILLGGAVWAVLVVLGGLLDPAEIRTFLGAASDDVRSTDGLRPGLPAAVSVFTKWREPVRENMHGDGTDQRGSVVISIDAELGWGFHDLESPPRERIERSREGGWCWPISSTSTTSPRRGPSSVTCCSRTDGTHADHPQARSGSPGTGRDGATCGSPTASSTASSIRRSVTRIACHTFSHVLFGDSDTSREVAVAELEHSRTAFADAGLEFTSFVFPRNQVGHRDVLAEYGVEALPWRARPDESPPSGRPPSRCLARTIPTSGADGRRVRPRLRPALAVPLRVQRDHHRIAEATVGDPVVAQARLGIDAAAESGGYHHVAAREQPGQSAPAAASSGFSATSTPTGTGSGSRRWRTSRAGTVERVGCRPRVTAGNSIITIAAAGVDADTCDSQLPMSQRPSTRQATGASDQYEIPPLRTRRPRGVPVPLQPASSAAAATAGSPGSTRTTLRRPRPHRRRD